MKNQTFYLHGYVSVMRFPAFCAGVWVTSAHVQVNFGYISVGLHWRH